MLVVKLITFKEWMKKNYSDNALADMVKYGAANGFARGFLGMQTRVETTRLYQRFKTDIWEILDREAQSHGCATCPFVCKTLQVDVYTPKDIHDQILVWHVAQQVAKDLIMEREQLTD